ncbi:MAG: hypothetical protein ACRD3D_07090 [Terriglobia bacterium]
MAEESTSKSPPSQSVQRSLVRAGVTLLFTAVLAIPKLRRLRRNRRAWNTLRVISAVAGAWLVWHGFRSHSIPVYVPPGIILILFGALIRARPVRKTADEVSRELGALIALNGGVLIDATHLKRRPCVAIYVTPERLVVLSADDYTRFEEIPIASIQAVAVHPAAAAAGTKPGRQTAWDLEITWDSGEISTRFRYEGSFAEHLARVAEKTLNEVWKKRLPVM